MSRLLLSPQDQIQRLHAVENAVTSWSNLEPQALTFKPEPGKWSVLEVVAHMNQAYRDYAHRIDDLLSALPDKELGYDRFKARWLISKLIQRFRPVDGKRKWKMGTMAKFEPSTAAELPEQDDIDQVFQQFFAFQKHLKDAILRSRSKDVRGAKIDSAIGPVVRFYLPEAFDFLISHEERHVVQGQEVLEQARTQAITV